jgi:hypothetical protein
MRSEFQRLKAIETSVEPLAQVASWNFLPHFQLDCREAKRTLQMRIILVTTLFLLPISAVAATAVHHPAARVRPHPLYHMRDVVPSAAVRHVRHPVVVHHPAARVRPHPLYHMNAVAPRE